MEVHWESLILGLIVGHTWGVATLAIWAGLRRMKR
jgi:hypothetical protein